MNTQDEKLDYRLFLLTVKEHVVKLAQNELGGDHEIALDKVLKNNSVELDALAIRERGTVTAPNIFLNPYYREYLCGKDIETIAREVMDIYLANKDRMDVSRFGNFLFEELKDRIFFKLVNLAMNSELLEKVPYVSKGDFALIFACLVEHGNDGIASIRIDNSLMEKWNTCPEELYELAVKNTARMFPPKVFNLNRENLLTLIEHRMSDNGIKDLFADGEDGSMPDWAAISDGMPMLYVLTNADGVDGATCIAYEGMLERIYRRLGVQFFILPSSVHEVIILPDDGRADEKALCMMVGEINESTVSDMDILSNRVYHFPGDVFGAKSA